MSIVTHERASSEQPCVIVVDDAAPEIQSEIERMRRLAENAPLISANPERTVICNEAECDRAMAEIEKLLKKGDLISAEENNLLDLLSTLVEKYEDERYRSIK